MKTLSIALIFAFAVAAAAGFYGWRGSHVATHTALADQTSMSNKLHQATARITEQESALETLKIKLKLQGEDVLSLSNRLYVSGCRLTEANERTRQESARAQVRQAEIGQLKSEASQLRQAATNLQEQVASLKAALSESRSATLRIEQRLAEISEHLNASESDRARLLQQWDDPAAVRARQRALLAPPPDDPQLRSCRAPLIILPDGRVALAPEVWGEPP